MLILDWYLVTDFDPIFIPEPLYLQKRGHTKGEIEIDCAYRHRLENIIRRHNAKKL